MKYTLLELVQSTLRSIKGEAVNSIADTQESLDVASIIKECYFTIISRMDLPETKTLFELEASGSLSRPVLMTLPDDVYSMEWLKYDVQTDEDTEPNYRTLTYLAVEDFLDRTNSLDTSATEVDSMDIALNGDTIPFKFTNDRGPTYYTSFNDSTIIFDSYDSAVDSFLQKSKSQGFGIRIADWEDEDTFVPNLDSHQFQLLLKEAKAMAWQEMKSIENVAAQRSARQLMISAKAKRDRANQKNLGYYNNWYPNYGRK